MAGLWENFDLAPGRNLNTDLFPVSPALLILDLTEQKWVSHQKVKLKLQYIKESLYKKYKRVDHFEIGRCELNRCSFFFLGGGSKIDLKNFFLIYFIEA